MSLRLTVLASALTLALAPAAAQGHATHLVLPGETLSGIAAANGLSTRALAAVNGVSPEAFVIAGHTILVPAPGTVPAGALSTSTAPAAPAPLEGYRVRVGDTLSGIAAEHGISRHQLAAANGISPDTLVIAGTSLRLPGEPTASTASTPGTVTAGTTTGGHYVTPGETLSGIAAANGITPAALAAANGVSPSSWVIAGTRLRIPAVSPAVSVPATSAAIAGGPVASAGRLSGDQIGLIAGQYGAPSSLAKAIAWQESGFNNNMVSVANARGIMQVIPATWDYVQRNLSSTPLDPASPADNVKAGSLLLADLLRQTGDPATAVAAYYQGLGSVRRVGMLPETQRYVANVMALRSRFGG